MNDSLSFTVLDHSVETFVLDLHVYADWYLSPGQLYALVYKYLHDRLPSLLRELDGSHFHMDCPELAFPLLMMNRKDFHKAAVLKSFGIHTSKETVYDSSARLQKLQKALSDTHLVNVHHQVRFPKDVMAFTVQGPYLYFHYNQDRIVDQGWGCAYRSLQTLSSWLILNRASFSDYKIPMHRDVQQILVDIGDKPASFIGSKEWIGCNESGFVLNQYFGIDFKILSVFQAQNIDQCISQLFSHFIHRQSPIMIGGGVLALTLLGMCSVGEGMYKMLILDPHYVQGKHGFPEKACYWADPSQVFVKDVMYNLLIMMV